MKDEAYFAAAWARSGFDHTLDRIDETVKQQPFSTFGGLMVGMAGGVVVAGNLTGESHKATAEITELEDQNESLITAQRVLDQGDVPQAANDQAQYALDMQIISNNQQIGTLQAQETNSGSGTKEVASYMGIELGMAVVGAVALTAASRGIRNVRSNVLPRAYSLHASLFARKTD